MRQKVSSSIPEETSEKFNYRKLTIQTETESNLSAVVVGEEDVISPEPRAAGEIKALDGRINPTTKFTMNN